MKPAKGATKPWTCPTCAEPVATAFCPACGESPVHPRDLTLRGLVHQLFDAFSNIDGRLFRSLRAGASRPGSLTVAWVNGPRKPYLGPFQLFLIANVVFVAIQSITGANVFSSTLDSHLHHQDWSEVAQRMVDARLTSTHTTLEAYTPVFNQAVALHAKSLVILMTIPFALLLPVVFARTRKPFALHAVFAVHVYTFLLFLYCAALALSGIDLLRGGAGLADPRLDRLLTVFNLVVCAAYLHQATGRVYGAKGVWRIVASVVLSAAILAIVLAYRFGLLWLTLHVA
jgi:hypothetical protein